MTLTVANGPWGGCEGCPGGPTLSGNLRYSPRYNTIEVRSRINRTDTIDEIDTMETGCAKTAHKRSNGIQSLVRRLRPNTGATTNYPHGLHVVKRALHN